MQKIVPGAFLCIDGRVLSIIDLNLYLRPERNPTGSIMHPDRDLEDHLPGELGSVLSPRSRNSSEKGANAAHLRAQEKRHRAIAFEPHL